MTRSLFILIAAYFLFGAICIVLINSGKNNVRDGKMLWLKYGTYMIVVSGVLCCLTYTLLFPYLAFLILILGYYEIIRIRPDSRNFSLIIPILTFSLLSAGFLFYAFGKSDPHYLFLYVLVFTFDGFSQISGQLFGKHKLISGISPAKTVEGLCGGVLATVLTAVLLGSIPAFSLLQTISFSILVGS